MTILFFTADESGAPGFSPARYHGDRHGDLSVDFALAGRSWQSADTGPTGTRVTALPLPRFEAG
jgi:hypothetical protein